VPNLQATHLSDIGSKRKTNQDFAGVFSEIGLFIVSDGMGGHQGGETASRMSVELVADYIKSHTPELDSDPKTLLSTAIKEANKAIYKSALDNPFLKGMGTTTTCLLINKNKAYIGQVGDSRCYFLKDSGFWQLTRDHSLVQEKLRAHIITREQAKTDKMKNVITRSVGFEPDVKPEIFEKEISAGDLYLLCSDGLSSLVEDPETHTILSDLIINRKDASNLEHLKEAVDILIKTANTNGGDDNITALIVEVKSL